MPRFGFPSSAPRLGRGLFVLALVAVLAATLTPSGGEKPDLSLCLVCGERGLADVLVNVILYMPLGAAIALCGWRLPWALAAPALLSLCIEFSQIWIPGRDPSLGDVTFNSLGAALGIATVASSALWLRPSPRARLLLAIGSTLGALAALLATSLLLQPDLPSSTYFAQWTPDLGHLEWYRGRVLRARLGPRDLPDGPLAMSDQVRSLLLARAPLRVAARAGPRVPALGSLFSIYDDQQREIALLGPDRDDLVFRYRTRAFAAQLDEPDLRAVDMLRGIARGDSLGTVVRADGRGYCLELNGRAACGLGFTFGSAWALLYYVESFPPWLKTLLDDAWLAGLLIPLGFWVRGRIVGSLLLVAVGAALVAVPPLTGLMPTPAGQLAGAAVGVAIGFGLRRVLITRLESSTQPSSIPA